ncbi:SecY interacting protein Syd [Providencia rustigianii]|uniref:Protein Syd n=3 Tax=Providencia rustigianii TaxID=158850 RepID=D1P1D7_9GAMM|nr:MULTISPECIES: SecY-interacting protein [Providencia]EFB72723.1 Syd protein [Providencia rustigianii DSM 4541]MTC56706.1 SecY-interacting protein [Providencia rustigianii]MTC58960.1 SecY-interacting protein [Providencia rustigianii]SPY78640.1 SecY interacting protein Syd [Providencia rustigianii]SUC28290.1 SecY interacting protein Syd [Providencia rustigianii]
MNTIISDLIKDFTLQYVSKWQEVTGFPPESSDLYGVPSPCIVRTGEDVVYWEPQPFPLEEKNLSRVAAALDIQLQDDIHAFYTSQFAGDISATFEDIHLNLLQVWNEDDFIRLQENLIGHLVTQKRLKLSPTLFIGTLDSELDMISMCNLTGEIILEKFGSKERRVLATNLASFIQQLKPALSSQG